MGSLSETYESSNGDYLGSDEVDFPVIVWNAGTTDIEFFTVVTEDLTTCHSLLPLYNTWKDSN